MDLKNRNTRSVLKIIISAAIFCLCSHSVLASVWVIKDIGLLDANNFVDIGSGSTGSILNSRIDLPGNPAARFNITLNGSGWQDIMIGDQLDLPYENAGIASSTGNGGDLSDYNCFSMTIHNPSTRSFMAALFIDTGYDHLGEPQMSYQNGDGSMTVISPGETVKIILDFNDSALWNGTSWTTGEAIQRTSHITNIGLKVGGNCDEPQHVQAGIPFDVDVASNVLMLDVPHASLYVKPGENIIINMDVRSLLQKVNACQAMLGYSSTYFPNPTAAVVAPGGGVWDLVIYDSWAVHRGIAGEIDTAIGLEAQGAVGTDADSTVAKVTLKTGSTEGITKLFFRPDAVPDPGLVKSTFFSDMNAQIIWPAKYNSQDIVIDGTLPVIDINSAKQGDKELLISLGSTFRAFKGVVNITVMASDGLAGLAELPDVIVTPQGGEAQNAAFINELPLGTFNYTWDVNSLTPNGIAIITASASDNSGNINSVIDQIIVDTCCWACTVDLEDLSMFIEQWLDEGSGLEADFIENNKVNFMDFAFLAALWMQRCPDNWPWP